MKLVNLKELVLENNPYAVKDRNLYIKNAIKYLGNWLKMLDGRMPTL